MNIFYLDTDPQLCAQYHCDKHVLKMIVETAQLLSTAWHILQPGRTDIYATTHANHPCAIWARASRQNYSWLYRLGMSLCLEYTHRYGKRHKTQDVLERLVSPPLTGSTGMTPFAQAMPPEYRCEDALEAYRAYYREAKAAILTYKNRPSPEWLSDNSAKTILLN
jgi:hypothetical protein